LFDLGAAVGEVNIDNVSLIEKVTTGGGTGGGGSTAFGIKMVISKQEHFLDGLLFKTEEFLD
jgi:hypothetical protein